MQSRVRGAVRAVLGQCATPPPRCFSHTCDGNPKLLAAAAACGEMLAAMGVGGTEGMTAFYDTCLATLYPPGQCAED